VSTDAAATAADAEKQAAIANAGAQTVQASKLQKFLWIFSPYRPDIQQGNFVSQEMLNQLKVGQTRDQVRFLLGSPLLTDAFHADRWDYPFYLARGNGELTTSRVTIFFKDNVVERFEGGNLPSERDYIDRIAGPAKVPVSVWNCRCRGRWRRIPRSPAPVCCRLICPGWGSCWWKMIQPWPVSSSACCQRAGTAWSTYCMGWPRWQKPPRRPSTWGCSTWTCPHWTAWRWRGNYARWRMSSRCWR